jgi:phage FluMu gp28-like protein
MILGEQTYFLPYQRDWVLDPAPLKICEKGRQIGLSYADSYDSVRKVTATDARLDVWVSSRDELQAKQYLLYCKQWAKILGLAAEDLGQQVVDKERDLSAFVLRFASGLCIYSLSSNPDAIAGKTGHIKLDEFALHKDQRQLYRIAKPATQWGGTLSIISTHRGVGSVFAEIVRDIKERGNRMGWSLHTIPVQKAVEQGLVERIGQATGKPMSREAWLAQIRAECLDEEQWQQEYCCIPSDDSTAFLDYEIIAGCEETGCLRDFAYLEKCVNPLYLGMDIARRQDLTVIDVGEKIGDVMWDRLRLELRGATFAEQEFELYQLLNLPQLRRACLDATGMGEQLAERARTRWGYKVEAVRFTGPVKEQLAFPLRSAMEDRKLRLSPEPALRADLRGVKKEVTAAGNIRFAGESDDSHCDRFWAKALRQHAAATHFNGPLAFVA